MKKSIYLALVLAAAAGQRLVASTTIQSRTISAPGSDQSQDSQQASSIAHIPVPDDVANQPAAVLPADKAEIRRRVAAAVEEVLALYGNPPFAEVITNDGAKSAQLRRQLALVGQADELREEITALTAERDALKAEVAANERANDYFREKSARLREAIALAADQLEQTQPPMEQGIPAAKASATATGK